MKKIILLLFTLLLSLTGFAQFTEGFEGTAGPDALPSTNWTLTSGNWAVFDNNVGTNQRWKINTTAANVHGGSNAAYVQNENVGMGNTSEDYLATPLVTIPANGQLRFWARTVQSGDQGTIYHLKINTTVGTQTTLANYTTVQQWTETSLSTTYNVYEEKIIDLTAYAGQQVYLAFMMTFTQPGSGLSGDRWLLDDVNLIQQCLVPTGLIANAGSTSASLSWTDPNGATSWVVEVAPAATGLTGTGTVVTSLPYIVSGLTPNTNYVFSIMANCINSGSDWCTPPVPFTTTIAPVGCGGNFVDSGGINGSYQNSENITTLVCPNNPTDLVTVTFTAFSTENCCDHLSIYSGSSVATGTLLGTYQGTTLPPTYSSTVPGGCLTFVFTSDSSVTSTGWTANITCAPAPSCTKPTGLTATSVLSTSAVLTWNQAANPDTTMPSAWQVIALPCGSPTPTATTTGWIAATSPYTMGGLSPTTCYDFYVMAICSSTDTSTPSIKASATTQALPPVCGGNYVDSGGTGASYQNGENITTTICPTNPTDLVTVTFNSFATENCCDHLSVYAGNSASGTLLGTYQGTTIPPAITSTTPGGCLTFVFTSDSSVTAAGWVANITCAPAPTCTKPTGLTATTVLTTTATLGWTQAANPNASTASAWQVIALPCGSTAPTAATTGWTAAPTNPFVLNGLTPSTCYDFYVRAVCSASDSSVWSVKATATTQALPPVCGGNYVDSGGSANTYQNNENTTTTICPTNPTDLVTVNFTSFATENCCDHLSIYDGSSASAATLLGTYQGTTLPPSITSSSPGGCLTFVFTSDNSVTAAGWVANIICAPAPTCPKPSAVTIGATTQTTASISWTNNSSATSWQVIVLPASAPAPTATTTGWVAAPTNPFLYTGLTIGTSYVAYVRAVCSSTDISLWSNGAAFNTTFGPPISSSTTQYTTQQLVEDVLINSTCSTVSNITSSSGNNFGTTNGIGYFNQNGSTFPFADGIILSSGNANSAPGPNSTTLSDGGFGWPGDTDLDNIILAATGNPMNSQNASVLEFDFVPVINNLTFNFVFASEEYGTFQCSFSDAFAFLLTDVAAGTTTNLAVIPSTTTPISVVTVRDDTYNNTCTSANQAYFDKFYQLPAGLNPLADPTNFNGLTIPITASSPVIPGHQYHIKIVVADRSDTAYDSAVFIQGGSFNIGSINLGSNLLVSTNNALCANASHTLQTGLDPTLYTFVWSLNGTTIVGQTGANITVTQGGHYQVVATYINTTCSITSAIDVEYYSPVVPSTPNNLTACSTNGFASFDLTQNNAVALGTLNPANFTVTYHATQTDANNGTNPLVSPYTNTTANLQTIYVRVTQNAGGCYGTTQFNLIVNPLITPTFIAPAPICANATAPILPTTSQNGITGTWAPAVVDNTVTGTYTFTPTAGQCGAVTTMTVTVNPNCSFGSYASAVWLTNCVTSDFFNTVGSGTDIIGPAANVFPNTNLGVYVQNSSSLILRGAEVKTFKSAVANVCSARLNYRIYPQAGAPGAFTTLDLPFFDNCGGGTFPTGGPCNTGDQKWQKVLNNSQSPIDLTTYAPGNYIVEVYYDISGSSSSTSLCNETQYINNNGANYIANFTIQATPNYVGVNPTVCNATDGTITISNLAPNTTYSLSYTDDGSAVGPLSITSDNSGVYTITGLNAGAYANLNLVINGCTLSYATTITLVNPVLTPTFTQVAPICSGDALAALPTTSTNSITGTWSPAIDNTTTTTYNFTPDVNQCSLTTSMTIVVTPKVIPTFTQVADICPGAPLSPLPTTSDNGVHGSWTPPLDNTTTTTYTFTPDTGICATTATMTINVNPSITPTFTSVSPICNGDTLNALPTTSGNGITGTWAPPLDNTATTIYTFTPNGGQCGVTTTLTIVVNQPVQATFNAIAPICNGDALTLPPTSIEGFTGTWTPAVDNTVTTTYLFTPDAGQCAASNTLTVVVNQPITPTFNAVAPICNGDALAALPATSINGYNGTWSPALDNTATTTYFFTPTTGQCATQTSLTIVVNQPVTPTFNAVAAICNGDALAALPTTSINGYNGTWSPALDNTTTTTYTFTPNVGQCATTTTLQITVNPKTTPTFTAVAAICNGDALAALPTSSLEGIPGAWTPALNNAATTTYTFTPSTGQCATTTTLTITVNPKTTPTFSAIATLCPGDTAPALSLTSINGYTGTWSPAVINNTQSGTYTFTPASGQCATTATLNVTVQAAFDFDLTDGCLDNVYNVNAVPANSTYDPNTASYSWQVNGVTVANETQETFNVTHYVANTTPTPNLPLTVTATVTTTQSCSKAHSVVVDRIYCEIQKGISPNGDTKNEFLDLRLMNVSNLEIYNRYGTKVYSQTNYSNEWVGQDLKGNELPDGTYYYSIEFSNNQSPKTGWIYINRQDK